MQIPISPESADDFIERVASVLQDDGTHIYLDTSFLMWLTTIGPVSRGEFFTWAATLNDRVHVPLWSMHEYYRHHGSQTLKKRLMRSLRKLSSATKAFVSDVRPYADRQLLPGQPEAAYREALRAATDRLEELTKLAKAWDYESSAAETLTWMNGRCCADDTVFRALPTLTAYGTGRYTQDVPPGFEDRRKKDKASRGSNRFGDLLFWEEVKVHAKLSEAKTVVVVSNDRKKDWFFKLAVPEIDSSWKRLRARWDPVPVPHPTLAFELKVKSDVGSLELLDQLYLGAIIWKKGRPQFERFASIAIDISPAQGAASDRPATPPVKPSQRRTDNPTIGLTTAISLVEAAMAAPDAATSGLLLRMEGNAPSIEAFIEAFSEADLAPLRDFQLACFARSLHDRALSGSGPAQALAARLLGMLGKLNADTAACIYLGLAVSAYFADQIPRPRPTSSLLSELFAWQDDPALPKVIQALQMRLVKDRSPALYFPNAGNRRVNVVVEHDSQTRRTPAELTQVYFDRQALITPAEIRPEFQLRTQVAVAAETSVQTIIQALCSYYGVPLDLTDLLTGEPDELRSIPVPLGLEEFDRFSGQPAELGGADTAQDATLEELGNVDGEDTEFDEPDIDEEDESE